MAQSKQILQNHCWPSLSLPVLVSEGQSSTRSSPASQKSGSQLITKSSRHLAPRAHVQLRLPLRTRAVRSPRDWIRKSVPHATAEHNKEKGRVLRCLTKVASRVMSGEIWGCGTTGASSLISGSGLSSGWRSQALPPLQSSRD